MVKGNPIGQSNPHQTHFDLSAKPTTHLLITMPSTVYQHGVSSITLGASGARLHHRNAPYLKYPCMSELVRRAEECSKGDKADSFDNLYLEDLVHVNAITSIRLMDIERVRGVICAA
jgi:hypothetical protein